jgi:triose/dihydroxyacetone kinase / FAD-AMP lyase (cyclizing)
VQTALQSVILTNPFLALDAKNKIVYLSTPQPGLVSVVSGGGSGHEPAFAAFVGRGLLTAAVTGSILASPDPEQVRIAMTEKAHGGNGILAVVMNNQVSTYFLVFPRISFGRFLML